MAEPGTTQQPSWWPFQRTAQRETGQAWWYVAVVLFLVFAALLARKLLENRARHRAWERFWRKMYEMCRARGIAAPAARAFVQTLRALHLRHPRNAVNSMSVFDDVVSDPLQEKIGADGVDKIRYALFIAPTMEVPTSETLAAAEGEAGERLAADTSAEVASWTEPAPARPASAQAAPEAAPAQGPLERTEDLVPGQSLQVHFEGAREAYPCGVLDVDEDRILVTVRPDLDEGARPAPGQRVEGHLAQEDKYYTFQSEVLEVFPLLACRIRHADEVRELQRREFMRVRMDVPFKFLHYPTAGEAPPDPIELAGRRHGVKTGVLRDISAGGCGIQTADNDPPIHAGDTLRFPVSLPDAQAPVTVHGTVLRVVGTASESAPDAVPRALREAAAARVHVQFIGLEEAVQHRIVRAVFQLREQAEHAAAAKRATESLPRADTRLIRRHALRARDGSSQGSAEEENTAHPRGG